MWVTNRERHHRFICDELLPHWGLTHVATWFWLKVTNAGELVSPMVCTYAQQGHCKHLKDSHSISDQLHIAVLLTHIVSMSRSCFKAYTSGWLSASAHQNMVLLLLLLVKSDTMIS